RREIIKIRGEINNIESKNKQKNSSSNNKVEQINETKTWLFEKINKIDKPLARLLKKKRERTQIDKITNENGLSQLIPQKYKQLSENTMKKLYANKTGQPERKGQIPRHPHTTKTQMGRNRKFEQTHK
ncbi:hypothetical protein NEIPOLOT_02220, partial [Neisseria polysaccharea ATCC 43768]